MNTAKNDIIAGLRKEILVRHGLQKTAGKLAVDLGLDPLNHAFPGHQFPLSAVHEFVCKDDEQKTAGAGFIAALLSPLMKNGGVTLWISPLPVIFPAALIAFGIKPDKIVFIHLTKEKELLWIVEEALKCEGLAAVVGEIRNLDFTASRRFQLAVEQSRVTGFIIRQTEHLTTNACVSRWKITTAPSITENGLPGLGLPRWNVELLKMRNGKPGRWLLEWNAGKLLAIPEQPWQIQELERKAG